MGYNSHGKKGDRKKLSWIYRQKKRLQSSENPPTENKRSTVEDNKKARIIVRNLAFQATNDDVRKFFEPFGVIQEINLLRHPDGKLIGCGFVQFERMEDASKAIFNTNKKEFLGRVIHSSWAISKSKFCEKLQKKSTEGVEGTNDLGNLQSNENRSIQVNEPSKKRSISLRQQSQKKLQREKSRKKRARIIIRNLSFEATEEDLTKHFSPYGTIEEVQILKRSDGKSIGCAFLQFEHVQNAAKAIHYANSKPLLNRPIVVDWAVPKTKFSDKTSDIVKEETAEVKPENENEIEDPCTSEGLPKTSKDSENEHNSNEELGSDSEKADSIDNEESGSVAKKRKTKEEGEDVSNDEESEEEETGVSSDEESAEDERKVLLEENVKKEKEEVKRPRRESHDIAEGKTVFLKNVPFSVKNEQLKKYMERFGPVYYALVCMDPLTEFSKGTAFVKFQRVEDAEKCLSAGTELQIEEQILEAQKALERNEVENRTSLKERRIKDSRNLYLVKEGVVLAGSPAAVGVSTTDMAKRLQVEQWKSQILRNLNMFVSRIRLVVHNLPASLDDEKLRKIFERHSGTNAIIREARVMRDLKNVDAKGVGKSKEYGFVSFTNHEDALRTLRSVNNNPNIFSPNRRPIVSFSIENRIMVNAKQRRVQKSRDHNPLWTENNSKRKNDNVGQKIPAKRCKVERTSSNVPSEGSNTEGNNAKVPWKQSHRKEERRGNKERRGNRKPLSKANDVEKGDALKAKPYVGTMGMPGKSKLRSKFNLKSQAILHNQAVKKEKKMNKTSKKLQMQRKEKERSRKEIKPRQGKRVNVADGNLDKLVNSYKTKLNSIDLKKSKWYDT